MGLSKSEKSNVVIHLDKNTNGVQYFRYLYEFEFEKTRKRNDPKFSNNDAKPKKNIAVMKIIAR